MDAQEQKPFVIGLDLGGTNSVFGIVDQRGQVLATNAIKTQSYKTVEDFVDAGIEVLKPIIANSNYSKIKRKEKSRQPETIPVGDFWSLSEKLSERFEKMKC